MEFAPHASIAAVEWGCRHRDKGWIRLSVTAEEQQRNSGIYQVLISVTGPFAVSSVAVLPA